MPRRTTRRQLRGGLQHVHPCDPQALQALPLPDADPLAGDWPVEVLLRCVALQAHALAGRRRLGRLTVDDERGRRLWGQALADVAALDGPALAAWLDAPRAVPVRCDDGATHRLVLDGPEVRAEQHPGIDLVAEQVAVALGGRPLGCVRALQEVTDPLGPRTVEVGLLRWLQVVRTWARAGHGPAASHVAVEAGLLPDALREHLAAGLPLPQAVAWVGVPVDDVLRWRALGASASQAEAWTVRGRTVADAERAVALLAAPRTRRGRTALLTHWVDGRSPLEEVVAWAGSGRDPHTWGELAARRITAAEAQQWADAGFGPAEVLRFHALRVPLADAVLWQQEMTALEASRFLATGVPLPEAVLLRDLPHDAVRRLWPGAGSAAEVRRRHTEEQAQGLPDHDRRSA